MQVVIEISEQDYELACKWPDALIAVYAHAIKNGTPLLKGHGDLIDRNSILCGDCFCEQCGHTDECFKLLAPTIIKADKG